MAQHAQLRVDIGLRIYFCDPRSPWQRGTNENTNGLLRQYFPKGTDLTRHSADDLAAVAAAINSRPRKTLGWKPQQKLSAATCSRSIGALFDDPLNLGNTLPSPSAFAAARWACARRWAPSTQLVQQRHDRTRDRIADCFGAIPSVPLAILSGCRLRATNHNPM
jgi:hypothetical protein